MRWQNETLPPRCENWFKQWRSLLLARTPFSAATTRLPEVFDAPRWIVRAGGYNRREVLCEYPLEWARGTPRKRGAEPEKGFD